MKKYWLLGFMVVVIIVYFLFRPDTTTGTTVSFSFDQPRYEQGEPIIIQATLENHLPWAKRFHCKDCFSKEPSVFGVRFSESMSRLYEPIQHSFPCEKPYELPVIYVDPFSSHTETFVFTPKPTNQVPKQALKLSFLMDDGREWIQSVPFHSASSMSDTTPTTVEAITYVHVSPCL